MRIVSYNVRYFGHALRGLASTRHPKEGIAKALSALTPVPDIVCMQEVETISLRSRAAYRGRPSTETQLESFMAILHDTFKGACPYEAYYFRAHRYGTEKRPIYTTGLAILVNKATISVDRHNQHQPHSVTFYHVEALRDRKQTRICAHMRLLTPSGPLHVFNTHLSLPNVLTKVFWAGKQRMGFGPNQLREAHNLVKFMTECAGEEPFVVCGDFNSPPSSPVYRFLTHEAGLQAAQEQLGLVDISAVCDFPTAGFAGLRMHLDHVFGHPRVHWLDMSGTCRLGDKRSAFHGLSDHMPLLATFAID